MKNVEILLQGEHIPDIQLVEVDSGRQVKDLLEVAAGFRKEAVEGDFFVFLEDGTEPLGIEDKLSERVDGQPVSLHVHRCRIVVVTVTFNGLSKVREFRPGMTIAGVKRWAAVREFGMEPGDSAEHVLQVAGTVDRRPEPDTHIGSLVSCPDCSIAFDLVPLKRVEG